MNVLIVGGFGYIGGQIAKDNPDWDVYDNLLYEKYFYLPNNFISGDVRDTEKISKILPNYEAVIWLAAIVGDGACTLNPLLTKEVNEYSVKWLVDNYEGKIIFMSTCSVYGASDEFLTEESEVNPLSLYALTKLNSEQILLNNSDCTIFRLGTVFGCSLRTRFDLVVNIFTANAYTKGEMTVFGGEQWRPNIHVKDVARIVGSATDFSLYRKHAQIEKLFLPESHKMFGVFNLGGENLRIVDIANIVKENVPEATINITESPFEDNRNYKVDSGKLDEVFAFKPKFTVDDGVKDILELLESGRVKNPFDVSFHNSNFLSGVV